MVVRVAFGPQFRGRLKVEPVGVWFLIPSATKPSLVNPLCKCSHITLSGRLEQSLLVENDS